MNPENHLAEHERFEDLCMLSATGELTTAESLELQNHVKTCGSCKRALLDSEEFVNTGMAYLASEFAEPDSDAKLPWVQADARRELFKRVRAKKAENTTRPDQWRFSHTRWMGLTAVGAIAAVLLLLLAYRSGEFKGRLPQPSRGRSKSS